MKQLFASAVLAALLGTGLSLSTLAHGALFTNAKVVYVDTRSTAYGSTVVIQLVDATTGQALNLCSATTTGATATSYVAIPLTDPGARLISQSALLAKLTGSVVIGNTLEAANSSVSGYCQIANFGIG